MAMLKFYLNLSKLLFLTKNLLKTARNQQFSHTFESIFELFYILLFIFFFCILIFRLFSKKLQFVFTLFLLMDYLFNRLTLTMTVLQLLNPRVSNQSLFFYFYSLYFYKIFFHSSFFILSQIFFFKLMTIYCMADYIDIHLIVFLHYLSSLSIQSILSIRISQDKNQTAYYARQIYSRLIILSYQWQANTSLVSNIRMVYFIEAFNLWRIHWISIRKNQFEQYSALIKQRILLRLNRNVNDLKSLFLWKCQLYKLNWLQLIRSKILLQSKRCHSFFRF